jgi:hypothetical protein
MQVGKGKTYFTEKALAKTPQIRIMVVENVKAENL